MQLIAIQLQLCQNNLFSTIMQFHYNYTHDVINCHPSIKFWHMSL
jgi:hypothetical protein